MFHSCIVVSALIIFKTWWILLPTCVWCLIITDNSCNYGKQDQMLLTNKSCVPIFLVQPSPDLLTNNFPVNTVKTFRDLNLLQCYLCRLDDNIIDNLTRRFGVINNDFWNIRCQHVFVFVDFCRMIGFICHSSPGVL